MGISLNRLRGNRLLIQVKWSLIRLIRPMEEAIAYFYSDKKEPAPEQVRVVIFGQGRTGSTLLESLLCSTGYFRRNGELFNVKLRGEVRFPTRYIRGLSNWKSPHNFIFHVKVYQLTEDRKNPSNPTEFMETLYQEGWRVIYLRRKNKLRHTLSNIIAEHRRSYHLFDQTKKEKEFKILIDCENFQDRVEWQIKQDKAEKEVLENLEYCEVVYEDDLENANNHQETVNRILTYLSLEHRKASTDHKKINTWSLVELISNYNEFVECVYKNGWQDYLQE